MTESLAIAHVTPHPWGTPHEVNRHIERVCTALAARGHRVVIVAPSDSQELVRATRAAIRKAGREGADDLLPAPGEPPRVLAVGEALPAFTTRTRSTLPIDVSRTIEDLFTVAPLDICHVHEPFAPSTSAAALRHSRALNVGTFHTPTERLLSTQVARKLVALVFGRIDTRIAAFPATRELMDRYFPGDYTVVAPGTDAAAVPHEARPAGSPLRLVFVDVEERGALRTFLRALRRLADLDGWEATVLSASGESSTAPVPQRLRDRIRYVDPADTDEADVLARADVLVCASDGDDPAPDLILRGLAAGAVPLVSRLPVYEDVLQDGEGSLLFERKDTETLGAQVRRLVEDPALLGRLRAGAPAVRPWSAMTDDVEAIYAALAARRHDPTGDPVIRARLQDRRIIDVDLHMHTDHSSDSATPVEVLLATARDQGFGAIAVTDHNEVSGAFDAQAKAAAYGVKVIIAEEVKTEHQGEVIGLFLTEKIPRGLSMAETVAEIKRQGGLVYVPHPFDRMHSVPDYEHLLPILDDIDAIEVYNPRVAIGSFNEEAQRFAAKYRIVAGAGSDSHVAQGLGSVRIRMRDFDGPEEFLESLRDAEIVTKSGTLLYVQALKFLETKATPAGARRARRARRVKRATRKP